MIFFKIVDYFTPNETEAEFYTGVKINDESDAKVSAKKLIEMGVKKVIITLGKVAFENCLKFYKKKYNLNKKIHFKHGKSYILPDNIILIPAYHPSPRNVNTKLISLKMMTNLFKKVKKLSTI